MGGSETVPGGDGSGNWFTDFFNWLKEGFSAIGQWFQELKNGIGNFFSWLWENISNAFKTLGENIGNWFQSVGHWFSDLGTNIGNWFSNLWTNICNFFTKRDEDAKQETYDREDEVTNKANEMNGIIEDKFGAFYTLKDFLSEFWNAIQDSGDTQPEFYVTLPEFCGGGTFNVLDFQFYNNYRNYIHGIMAGIIYFVYIKRIYNKIPNVIHNS